MNSKKCPICEREQNKKLTSAEGYHACEFCGYVRQIEIESFDSIYEYYKDEFYDRADTTNRSTQKQKDWASHIVRFLDSYDGASLLNAANDKKAIEIGSAYGITLTALHEFFARHNRGLELYGVEISKECIKHGVEHYENIHMLSETLETLKTDEKFDIVILSHVLEHLRNPVEALRKVVTLSKEGAVIFVEVPNFFYHAAVGRAHISCFTPESLRNCLLAAGLTPIVLKLNDHESCFHKPFITCLSRIRSQPFKVKREAIVFIEIKRRLGRLQYRLHRAWANNLIWRVFRKIRRDCDPRMRLYG